MNEATYYQRNRDVILNRAKDYQKNDIERSRDARENTEIYLKENKNKKREYGRNRYHNMSEKQKLL